MRPGALLALAALALAPATAARADDAPARVEVTGPRVRLGDAVRGLDAPAADADLGPAPAPGGTRLVVRDEMLRALDDARAPAPRRLPAAVRLVRRMSSLTGPALERLVRDALPPARLPRGATLVAVRPPRAVAVAAGWTDVRAELPRTPRRAGALHVAALVAFTQDGAVLARVSVPVELALGPESAVPDLARGAPVRLVIARGLVEVTTLGVAAVDADVGETVPVLVRPSGRVVRARLVERDRAVAEELP